MRITTFDQFDMKNCNAYVADMLYNPILYFHPYNASCDLKLDDFCEFTFDVPYYYVDDVMKEKYKNPVYDYINCFRNIHLGNVGFFHVSSVSIEGDGCNESKHVTAYSAEHSLTHKYLNEYKPRVDEKNNDMVLYDPNNPPLSIMHDILDGTGWSVSYCDEKLAGYPVFLDVDRTSIYDLMINDIATLLDCKFIFDIENFEIGIYSNDIVGEDTNLNITFDNLMQNAEVSYEEDDIKTALRVEGEDIYITDHNGGSDTIVDLRHYATEAWMGAELAKKYTYYFNKRTERLNYYTEIQKYLDAATKRKDAILNNHPEDGLHLWDRIFQDKDMSWIIPDLEKQIYDAEQKEDQNEVQKLLGIIPYFINDFAFDYKRDSTYGKLILSKNYLILSDYGINYLKEGIQRLNELIKAENKKLEPNKDKYEYKIEYTKIHFYQLMYEFYSKALVKKKRTLRIHESLIVLLSKVLSQLSKYYSYKGFVHDDYLENSIFLNPSKWKPNKKLSKLFRCNDYEYIISKTNYFGVIENVSEYNFKWFENSNDICKDLNKTFTNYEIEGSDTDEDGDDDIQITKEDQPLESITFSYQPDGNGCNPWIYDIFIYAGFSSLGETFKPNRIPTASQDVTSYIKEKVGIPSSTPYFTEDEIRILKSLEIEEEYIDSNFKHYDDDTRAEILDKSKRLYNNGLEKIKTMNKPTLSFTADIVNPFMIDAFKGVIRQHLFALGNKINVVLRSDYVIQVTIKEVHVDFNEPENFSFTCDNANTLICKENSNIFRKLGASYRKMKTSK